MFAPPSVGNAGGGFMGSMGVDVVSIWGVGVLGITCDIALTFGVRWRLSRVSGIENGGAVEPGVRHGRSLITQIAFIQNYTPVQETAFSGRRPRNYQFCGPSSP